MHEILLQSGLAFLEGVGLVLSPCILPVLPLILAGGASGDRRKPFGIILGFVLSFTVFALLTRVLFSSIGLHQELIQRVSYGLLALLGLVMLVPVLEEGFSKLTQKLASGAQGVRTGEGFGGGVLMGILIGIVWTPCAGPILAAALLQVVRAKTDIEAIGTIVMFSLGAALPMLGVALSGKALAQKFGKHTVAIKRGMGIVLLAFAGLGLLGINIGAVVPTSESTELAAPAGEIVDGLMMPYAAPEITGITGWINSEPVTLESLKGKVVLVDFWTYSCINCIRTLPHLREWYGKYHDKGLEIIGVHAPEFAFEKIEENVRTAVGKYDVKWPVAMDNDFKTWGAYDNKYWPAHYLIGRDGQVVYTHFGEGNYDVTEHNIRALLGLEKEEGLNKGADVTAPGQTPETYVGNSRAAREWTGAAEAMPLHGWRLAGGWVRGNEKITSAAAGDVLALHFQAKKVFVVMASADARPVGAKISIGGPNAAADLEDGHVTATGSRLYEIVALPETDEGTVSITADGPGLEVYAFTFESGAQ